MVSATKRGKKCCQNVNFSCLKCFCLREKKQIKNPPVAKWKSLIFRRLKKNEDHHEDKHSSSTIKLEDSSVIGLPTSISVCQISSQSKFMFLRWSLFAAVRKSLQGKYCVTWWGIMKEGYCICHLFLTYLKRDLHCHWLLWCNYFYFRSPDFRKTTGFPQQFNDFPEKQWGDNL